jgi:putative transposase
MSDERHSNFRKQVKHYDNGEPHFLTFSCYGRLNLLSKDRTREWFVEALEAARKLHGFHLWAWVVMPEHVHLLLWPPFDKIEMNSGSAASGNMTLGRIPGILSSIKLPVAKKGLEFLAEYARDYLQHLTVENANRTYRRFWQAGSGYDENVSELRALHDIIEYIHLNPVRRGLVNRPEDWLWSSARDWMGLPGSPIKVDRTLPALLEIPWKDRRATREF